MGKKEEIEELARAHSGTDPIEVYEPSDITLILEAIRQHAPTTLEIILELLEIEPQHMATLTRVVNQAVEEASYSDSAKGRRRKIIVIKKEGNKPAVYWLKKKTLDAPKN